MQDRHADRVCCKTTHCRPRNNPAWLLMWDFVRPQKGETDRVEMLKEEEMWDIFFQARPLQLEYLEGP